MIQGHNASVQPWQHEQWQACKRRTLEVSKIFVVSRSKNWKNRLRYWLSVLLRSKPRAMLTTAVIQSLLALTLRTPTIGALHGDVICAGSPKILSGTRVGFQHSDILSWIFWRPISEGLHWLARYNWAHRWMRINFVHVVGLGLHHQVMFLYEFNQCHKNVWVDLEAKIFVLCWDDIFVCSLII